MPKIPSYRLYKASGQAIVWLNGRRDGNTFASVRGMLSVRRSAAGRRQS